MFSIIDQLPFAYTDDTLPIIPRDPLINVGSEFLFDFLNAYCNPNADGNLVTGATFNNMVDGGTAASLTGTTDSFESLTGKAGLYSIGTAGGYLDLGQKYDFSVSLHPWLYILWIKTPSTGYTSTAYTALLAQDNGSTNNAQAYFDMGPDGKTPRTEVGYGSGGPNSGGYALASGTDLGSVTQLAVSWQPTSPEVTMYVNGAQVGGFAASGVSTLVAQTGNNMRMGSAYKGTIYRAYLEDLEVSGALPGTQVANDYTTNASRFV